MLTNRNPENVGWRFDHSYATLPQVFFTKLLPEPVKAPELVILNTTLAHELGLDFSMVQTHELAAIFSGNQIPKGADPIAQAYAGHQFGHFTMLGDGRAILLGEHLTPKQDRIDIQLKGSGQTPYSRRGDGRATLKSMLREYLISEAMHGLGIRTSRSLAVAKTGETVVREQYEQGAVLTRVASSHLRVGTFEYARHFLSIDDLQQLTDYTIKRHYPTLTNAPNRALGLLKAVMKNQIETLVNWMRVGFIHGVMNTDNMSISGETIDYGPCAFMNTYRPETVFSSIDTAGRYAFGNQPTIGHWNLAAFASALLPLIHQNSETALAMAQETLNSFTRQFNAQWQSMMLTKIGIQNPIADDMNLLSELLQWMEQAQADYTNTFLALQHDEWRTKAPFNTNGFNNWHNKWLTRINCSEIGLNSAYDIMSSKNPVYIPRNHWVEEALDLAANHNNLSAFNQLIGLCSDPYTYKAGFDEYQLPPKAGDANYKTFCGT